MLNSVLSFLKETIDGTKEVFAEIDRTIPKVSRIFLAIGYILMLAASFFLGMQYWLISFFLTLGYLICWTFSVYKIWKNLDHSEPK